MEVWGAVSKEVDVNGPKLNVVMPVLIYKAENQNNKTPDEKALNNKYLIDASTPAKGRVLDTECPIILLYLIIRGCKPHNTKKQKF